MDDQGSPPLLPRRRSRSLSEIPELGPSQATRDKRRLEMGRRPSPIDVDDLLAEILLRLPALPSSLPRASLVCTRWRRIVTDPDFLRRFRARHWKPLGVFLTRSQSEREDISFRFISDPLGSIPPGRFSVPPVRAGAGDDDYTWVFLGCRHGRVLLIDRNRHGYGRQMLVWNPIAAEHHLLDAPHFLDRQWNRYGNVQGAVICASGHEGSFKVALAWDGGHSAHACVYSCVYSSETGEWGDVLSTAAQRESGFILVGFWNVLVGNSLYWLLFGFGSQLHIVQLDFGSQNLAVIEVPSDVYANHRGLCLTTLANGGGLSLMVMAANLRAQLWERAPDSDGTARWMLGGTIELDKLLSLRPGFPECRAILGVEGDHNVMFVSTYRGVFMVHLESMQFEKIFKTNPFIDGGTIHPFTTLHAPGTC
ncbi:unnamed protein product [Urochloa decumbens]|uniref:F-box domain-containing protein n=1 Tax=Urochloa decumbens TaxID=240449 RepID=A0ABC8WPS3_9POAL